MFYGDDVTVVSLTRLIEAVVCLSVDLQTTNTAGFLSGRFTKESTKLASSTTDSAQQLALPPLSQRAPPLAPATHGML